MNAKKSSIIMGSALAGTLAMVSCSGPPEENLRVVPLTMPMASYNPNTRVVVAGVDYTEVHDEWMNPDIMKKAKSGNTRVVISRSAQRGQLMVGDEVAMDFPVCLGTSTHKTPLGHFNITEKKVHHVSNLYDASMPYFMRLTDGGIGMHGTRLPNATVPRLHPHDAVLLRAAFQDRQGRNAREDCAVTGKNGRNRQWHLLFVDDEEAMDSPVRTCGRNWE